MKNLLLTAAVLAVAAAAFGTTYYCNCGIAGGTDVNPVSFSAKTLADKGTPLASLDLTQSPDNGWLRWTEPTPRNYDFMIYTFTDPGDVVSSAVLTWRVGIDDDDNHTHLFYWHGNNNSWVWLAENDGGREPNEEQTDIAAAFNNNGEGNEVVIMFVGYTPGASDDWIQCDFLAVDR